ncbi:hypothetical protein BDK92_6193 [Micromonospora pisi]|uniref:Uncharacterized protein n=1 Tax=Micromonospora pisi TaxID=589240 RepID=A0A495JTB9_9ACTN|nr:hypothetical protein BDK92_6193 [Micromonospora pisi]
MRAFPEGSPVVHRRRNEIGRCLPVGYTTVCDATTGCALIGALVFSLSPITPSDESDPADRTEPPTGDADEAVTRREARCIGDRVGRRFAEVSCLRLDSLEGMLLGQRHNWSRQAGPAQWTHLDDLAMLLVDAEPKLEDGHPYRNDQRRERRIEERTSIDFGSRSNQERGRGRKDHLFSEIAAHPLTPRAPTHHLDSYLRVPQLSIDGRYRSSQSQTAQSAHRLLVNWTYDRSPARLGRGDRRDSSLIGCPPQFGVALIWHAPAGHRGAERLKRGLPSSK